MLRSLPYTFLLDPRLKRYTPTSYHPLANSSLTPPMPSPSKITTWPPALRYVTKLLVPNPDFTRRIAHLIHTQHRHERQWWSGREALVQKLESREEGRKKLNDVLSVPHPFSFSYLDGSWVSCGFWCGKAWDQCHKHEHGTKYDMI